MRGRLNPQRSMLGFIDLEERVPPDHPLRAIKRLADRALGAISDELNDAYAADGRPSIPPERLLKASLLMALYSIRSERLFCEQLDYHLLFRWFLDMDLYEPGWDHSTFTKNRPRLLHFVGLALLAGGPAILGTWIGAFVYSPFWTTIFLAIGIGAILQVIVEVGRLIWRSQQNAGEPALTWATFGGVAAGIAVMYLTALLVAA